MGTELEKIAAAERSVHIARNEYHHNDRYNSNHRNALSDNDEKGKGFLNNSVGSSTDIKTRNDLVAKNKYNTKKEYYQSK